MNPSPNRPATDGTTVKNRIILPWALILLGALLFASQFLNSGQSQQPALSWYESSGLRQLEWENYLSWLRFKGNAEQAKTLEQSLSDGNTHAYASAMFSEQFFLDSDQRARDFWSAKQIEQWRTLREQIPGQMAQSSLYRWGLPEAAPRPSRFFTAPFTGGPIWLTLLALFGLALVAARLERQLGAGRLVVIWLAGSLLAGVGYLLMSVPGQVPLHGATPALLSLLCAAAVLSRQPIALTLPAGKNGPLSLALPGWSTALVPLVLIVALALGQSPMLPNLVAGLLAGTAGALLGLILKPHDRKEVIQEDTAVAVNPELQQILARGWEAIGKLDGDRAERHFQDAQKIEPSDFDVLTGLFMARQIQRPVPPSWRQSAIDLFNHPASETGQATQVAHHWKQYKQHLAEPLPEATLWQLVITLTNAGELQQAEQLVMQHADDSDEKERRETALQHLRKVLREEGLSHRAKALPE